MVVEVAELGVAVRVLLPFDRLGVALQAVVVVLEQPGHRVGSHPMAVGSQLVGKFHRRLGRPPQPRHRVTAGLGIHQLVQRRPQLGIGLLGRLSPGALRPDPSVDHNPRLQLRGAAPDGVRRSPSRRRDQLDPAAPQLAGTRPQQQSARSLVQHRSHLGERRRERLRERLREPHDLCHSTTLEIKQAEVDVISRRSLGDREGDQITLAGNQPRGEVGVDAARQRRRGARVVRIDSDLLQQVDLVREGPSPGEHRKDR